MASATSTHPTFHSTWLQFCGDLEGTFPELSEGIQAAKRLDAATSLKTFRALMRPHLSAIAMRSEALFVGEKGKEGVEVLPNVKLTDALWREVSETTHKAIWNYLSSLALLSACEGTAEDADNFWDEAEFKKGMEEMMKGLKEAGAAMGAGAGNEEGSGNPFAAMSGLFEKLKGMAESFGSGSAGAGAGAGGAAAGAGLPNIKIPERLFKGHIARMAKELADEFKPEDFGISADMLETSDPTKVFEYLQEIFTKKPEMLMAAAQRIAKRIQTKFMRGEIKRDEIIAEIEELMKEFSENEAFTSIFGQLGELLQSSAKATGNEGSERRRQVQERLRKKQAEKDAKKAAATSGSTALALRSSDSALAASEAAAAALLAEEERADAKKKKSSGPGKSK